MLAGFSALVLLDPCAATPPPSRPVPHTTTRQIDRSCAVTPRQLCRMSQDRNMLRGSKAVRPHKETQMGYTLPFVPKSHQTDITNEALTCALVPLHRSKLMLLQPLSTIRIRTLLSTTPPYKSENLLPYFPILHSPHHTCCYDASILQK